MNVKTNACRAFINRLDLWTHSADFQKHVTEYRKMAKAKAHLERDLDAICAEMSTDACDPYLIAEMEDKELYAEQIEQKIRNELAFLDEFCF